MQDKYEQFYHDHIARAEAQHAANAGKIRVGIRLLLIVPIFFLTLMFLTGANKAVFLVLFIISIFAIAIYLIYVEYEDFELQENTLKATDDSGETDSLLDMNIKRVGGVVSDLLEDIEDYSETE